MAVELTLARMKLALLRHSLRGTQQSMTVFGVVLGLAGAAATLVVAATGDARTVAAVYAVWMLGWALGPVAMGGTDSSLRPEHFALLGLRPRRLATGLLASAFVGLAPMVSLVALAGLLVVGARDGLAGVLLAVPALALQLALLVLLSRTTTELLRLALRSRLGAVGAGLLNGVVLAALCQVWVFLALFDQKGIPDVVLDVPSGWGVRAAQGDLAALGGLAVVDVALLALWGFLMTRASAAPRASGRPHRPVTARTPQGAVVAKELRTWTRDLARSFQVVFSLAFAVGFGAMPLLLGWGGMLPFAGPVFVAMTAAITSNLYGSDGTALWLSMMTGDVRDVRARQRAFLVAVGPVAVVVTLGTTAVAGGPWPLVLAVLPAVLGGAAGLVPLLSVYGLVPGIDPHKRGANPLRLSDDNGGLTGLAYLALALVALSVAPAALVAQRSGWAGVAVGLGTGVLWFWGLGLLAERRLAARAPDLLHAMRTGRRPRQAPRLPAGLPARPDGVPGSGRPGGAGVLLAALAAVPLFPQGVVAAIFVANGRERHTWFLATYMPPDLRWLTAGAMILLGLVLFGAAVVVNRPAWLARLTAGGRPEADEGAGGPGTLAA